MDASLCHYLKLSPPASLHQVTTRGLAGGDCVLLYVRHVVTPLLGAHRSQKWGQEMRSTEKKKEKEKEREKEKNKDKKRARERERERESS